MPLDVIEIDEFTTPVVAPEPGDDRVAASVLQAIQPLANRTLNLKGRIDAILADDVEFEGVCTFDQSPELPGTAEIKYSPPRTTRAYVLPPANAEWEQLATAHGSSKCSTANSAVAVRLPVPRGCTLTYVLVQVSSSGAAGHVAIELTRVTPDNTFNASAAPTTASLGTANNGGNAGNWGIQLALSAAVTTDSYIYLTITSSSGCDPSHPDYIDSITCDFTDVGPRNGG